MQLKNGIAKLRRVMMCKKMSPLSTSKMVPSELRNPWIKGKKPKIYDCYGVLETVTWIWRILGIFPFTIKGPMENKKYGINIFYAIYSFLMCSMCIGILVFGLTLLNYIQGENLNMGSIIITGRAIAIVLCLIISIWRIFRHKSLLESIEIIVVKARILEKSNCPLNYQKSAKIIRAYVWALTMSIIFMAFYQYYTFDHFLASLMLVIWLCWTIGLAAQIINLTIFVTLVGLLGLIFQAVNHKIKTVVMRANASSAKVITISDLCAKNLQIIAKFHHNTCVVGQRINCIFNWTVIINVLTTFITLSKTLYDIFSDIRKDIYEYVHIGMHISFGVIHCASIIAIVIICNWTTHQSIHAGKLIHEIRVEKMDTLLYENMKSLSLQLHHQKLEFNAGGFFPLNSILLQMIVGSITTYLVVLIQLQPNLHVADDPNELIH